MTHASIVDGADVVLLDVDGVLCLGDEPIDGAADALALLRARVPLVIAVTNDSRRSRSEQERRLARAGWSGGTVVTAVDALAGELRAQGHAVVAACGTPAFAGELSALGIETDAARATAVAIGAGADEGALETARAALARGLPAFAANADEWVPTPDGPIPDTGAVVVALGCSPRYCGKPEAPMTRTVRPFLRSGARVVVVGDGIATDLAWARANGWRSIYVGVDGGVDADARVATIGDLRAR